MLLHKVKNYHICTPLQCTVGTLQLTNGVVCQIWSTWWCKNILLFIAVLHEPLCIKLMTMLALSTFHRIHWITLCLLSRRIPQKVFTIFDNTFHVRLTRRNISPIIGIQFLADFWNFLLKYLDMKNIVKWWTYFCDIPPLNQHT